jgi:Cu(I)/Ag(I) efflux system membrane fusion protein
MKKIYKNQIVRFIGALVLGVLLGVWTWGGAAPEHEHIAATDGGTVWTCSMHPQIRQNEPGQCPICGMDLIPIGETGVSGDSKNPFVYKMSGEAVALANIQTSTVVYQSPETQVSLTGKIAVNEQRLGVITAHYAGRIEDLLVDYTGQQVQKGDKLATVYSPELITAQKELLETAKNKVTNAVLYQAAREKLRLWKITEAQINLIEETGEIVTEFDVYAHVSGIVLKRNVTKGDHINRGSALFEIADLHEVWVLLDAYESDLPWVQVGSKVNFTVVSLPGKVFTSTVTFIDPIINSQTRTAVIRTEVSNADLALKLDMFVSAQIKSSVSKAALLVPKTAVLWTGKRSVVYVDVSGLDAPAFEMREVVLGPRTGDLYVIESGIKEGDVIVAQGVFAVDAAAQLSGNYSMMNRPTGDDQMNRNKASEKAVQSPMQGHGH